MSVCGSSIFDLCIIPILSDYPELQFVPGLVEHFFILNFLVMLTSIAITVCRFRLLIILVSKAVILQ